MNAPKRPRGTLNYVNLYCEDIDRAFDFYSGVFLLEEIVESRTPLFRGASAGACSLGFSTHDVFPLLNLNTPDRGAGDRCWLTFDVADRDQVDLLTAVAIRAGASVLKEPAVTYYGWYQAVLRDPEGHAFRINYPA